MQTQNDVNPFADDEVPEIDPFDDVDDSSVDVSPLCGIVHALSLYGVDDSVLSAVVQSLDRNKNALDPNKCSLASNILTRYSRFVTGPHGGIVSSDPKVMARFVITTRVKTQPLAYCASLPAHFGKLPNEVRYDPIKREVMVKAGESVATARFSRTGEVLGATDGFSSLTSLSVCPSPFVVNHKVSLRYTESAVASVNVNVAPVVKEITTIDIELGSTIEKFYGIKKKLNSMIDPAKIVAKRPGSGKAEERERVIELNLGENRAGMNGYIGKCAPIVATLRTLSNKYRSLQGPKSIDGLTNLVGAMRALRVKSEDATKHMPYVGGPLFASIVYKQITAARLIGIYDPNSTDPVPLLYDDQNYRVPGPIFFGCGDKNAAYIKGFRANYIEYKHNNASSLVYDIMEYKFLEDDVVLSDVFLSDQYKGKEVTSEKGSAARTPKTAFECTYPVVELLVAQRVKLFSVKVILGKLKEQDYEKMAQLFNQYIVTVSMGGRHHNMEVFLTCSIRNESVVLFKAGDIRKVVGQIASYAVSVGINRIIMEATLQYEHPATLPSFAYPTRYVVPVGVGVEGYKTVDDLLPPITFTSVRKNISLPDVEFETNIVSADVPVPVASSNEFETATRVGAKPNAVQAIPFQGRGRGINVVVGSHRDVPLGGVAASSSQSCSGITQVPIIPVDEWDV
jgi:hypothetical protein